MKKTACIILSMLALCGCGQTTQQAQTTETTTEQAMENTVENDSEYSRDDFVLFAEDNGEQEAVIWLGMEKGVAEENSSLFSEYYEGIDTISYNTQQELEEGQPNGNTVDYVSLISYTGSRNYLTTQKGIRTAGLYDTATKPNSNAKDVIKAYGVDIDNESVYVGDEQSDAYTIVLYFNIDNHNKVIRVKPEKGTDVSDIANVSGADYFIKFLIVQDEVTGIQLYRQRPLDAK